MDTNKIKAFVEVCHAGSYSKVAKDLGYTHAGIAYMIKSLEEEVGFALVEKKGNNIVPTSKARRLMTEFLDVIYAVDRLNQAIETNKANQQSTLTIGTIESTSIKWIPLAVSRFRKLHPNVPVNILNGDPFTINEWLRDELIDLGLTDGTWLEPENKWVTLYEDQYYGIFPSGTASKGSITMDAFEGQYIFIPSLYGNRSITKLLKDHNIHYRHPADKTISMLSVISNVATGRGISISSTLMLDINNFVDLPPELTPTLIPIEPAQHREIGVSYKKQNDRKDLIKDFVRCLRDTIRDYPIKLPMEA